MQLSEIKKIMKEVENYSASDVYNNLDKLNDAVRAMALIAMRKLKHQSMTVSIRHRQCVFILNDKTSLMIGPFNEVKNLEPVVYLCTNGEKNVFRWGTNLCVNKIIDELRYVDDIYASDKLIKEASKEKKKYLNEEIKKIEDNLLLRDDLKKNLFLKVNKDNTLNLSLSNLSEEQMKVIVKQIEEIK